VLGWTDLVGVPAPVGNWGGEDDEPQPAARRQASTTGTPAIVRRARCINLSPVT
jgi:hypothetical protein